MAIDTQEKLMLGIMGIIDGYEGHGGLTTPKNHREHVDTVAKNNVIRKAAGLPPINAFTEAELEAGIIEVSRRKVARKAKEDTDDAKILTKLKLTKPELRKLKRALDRV